LAKAELRKRGNGIKPLNLNRRLLKGLGGYGRKKEEEGGKGEKTL